MSGQKKDRNYGASIAALVLQDGDLTPLPERRTELVQRGNALKAMSSEVVYNQLLWVDPQACRPSPVNARDYDALTYDDCAELIETLKSEGRQRTAAIVRPTGDPGTPYEIVAGLRRHWSIAWLRSNHYPDFQYLVDVQKLDDEAAFRLSDLENRARTDISDLERSKSYQAALQNYYDGNVSQMAERIGISERNLRRYLQMADAPRILIEALGGHRSARVSHARELLPILAKSSAHEAALLAEAKIIAAEQKQRQEGGEGAHPASVVVERLRKAAEQRPKRIPPPTHAPILIHAKSGKPMLEYVAGTSRTAAVIKLLPRADASRDEMHAEVLSLVDRFLDARGQGRGNKTE
jgi:ParB family chromosome partitioning protein